MTSSEDYTNPAKATIPENASLWSRAVDNVKELSAEYGKKALAVALIGATAAAAFFYATNKSEGTNPNPTAPSVSETFTPTTPGPTISETATPSVSPSETLAPQTEQEILVDRLTKMTYDEFIQPSVTPEERAVWCQDQIYPDLQDVVKTMYEIRPDELHTYPEVISPETITDQELINVSQYQIAESIIGHVYPAGEGIPPKDGDAGSILNRDETKKASACGYLYPDGEWARTQAEGIARDIWDKGLNGMTAAGYAGTSAADWFRATSSSAPSTTEGYWSKVVNSQASDGSTLTQNYAIVNFVYDGKPMSTVMVANK